MLCDEACVWSDSLNEPDCTRHSRKVKIPASLSRIYRRGQTMIPRSITADHVKAAIAEVDSLGVSPGRESVKYQLVYVGRRYPPKYVLSLAAKHAIGRRLLSSEFNGGAETNTFLRRLGFIIEGIGD